MIWELKQKYYKADTPLPYVSKASHKADEERAVKAIAEVKEYLDIVAKSRLNKHCRVF